MTYLIVYATILFSKTVTGGDRLVRSGLYYICLVGLFIFAGFRYEVGCDWSGYANIFEIQRYETIDDALQKSEPAFWLLNALVHQFGLDYPYTNVLSSAAFFFGLHALAKRQPDRVGFLILAFPVLILNLVMSANRQAIALGVMCLAYNAFVDKLLRRFVVLVMLASFFHSSALIFLLLAPLIHSELTWKAIFLSGIFGIIGTYIFMTSGVFDTYAQRYVGSEMDAAGALFRTGLLALTGIAFVWFFNDPWRERFPHDYKLVLLGSYLMIAIFPLSIISSVVGDRFGYYINPIQIIILARAPLVVTGKHRTLVSLAPYGILGLVLFVWSQASQMFNLCYEPYKMWW